MACATLKRSLDLDWEPVSAKRRRCAQFCTSPTHSNTPCSSNSAAASTPKQASVFPDVMGRKLTPEYMAESIKAELRKIQRRREMKYGNMDCSDCSSGGESPSRSDIPLFTFKQVGMICEHMLRERESEIRQEYDNVLAAKLSEQYDAFVRFTYDQIHRSYDSAPSYLS
ncbi:akirin [Coccinella septempunctata]|uniref:akirin n=1 Tax=Coccinella septempunctata TaxID=41139 RepID=UPI001D06F08F|nr:akirin [Coccinella septempunctata]